MAGENGSRALGGLTFKTYFCETLLVFREHTLMLTVRNHMGVFDGLYGRYPICTCDIPL